MRLKNSWKLMVACGTAGAINGLFSAGGGMMLVPLLTLLTDLNDDEIFPASIAVILPICVVSLIFRSAHIATALSAGLPYLVGSIPGGLLALRLSGKIPVTLLHRTLGILVLWGGVRYLC